MKIRPHLDAPLFSLENNPSLVLDQIIDEFESGNFSENQMRDYFRQAGLVNLWFFLKCIAGYNGPFNKLNSKLHVEMAEFYQVYAVPGNMAALFTGRGVFKTTICTIGGISWQLLRNPDDKWLLFSATHDRSIEFMWTIERIFDSNPLFTWLYPEFTPPKGQKRWNDEEMVLPNRKRIQTEPSVLPRGVLCSTAGLHGNIHIDDPVGDTQLDSMRGSSVEMFRIENWLRSNLRTLTSGQDAPITFHTGTRYAIDDAHGFIFENIKEIFGTWDDRLGYKPVHNGEWYVYNRPTRENGKSVVPEIHSDEKLDKIQKEEPWTYYTQFQNSPMESGLTELNQYAPKKFKLEYDERRKTWLLKFFEGEGEVIYDLADCDVVLPCDPAATETGVTSKTSRSAQGAVAHHASDRRFVLTCRADYVSPSTLFNWMFSDAKRFANFFHSTVLETQGAFKVLGSLLREEENRRRNEALVKKEKFYPLFLKSVTKSGNKEAVIRSTLEPLLAEGLLYLEEGIYDKVMEELNTFPQGTKKDILDMITLGCKSTVRPMDERELKEKEDRDVWFAGRAANAAGY